MDTRTLYDTLNTETLWIRAQGTEENGHSALYLPTRAILRTHPANPDAALAARTLMDTFAALYRVNGAPRAVLADPNATLIDQALPFLEDGTVRNVVFEGYGVNPAMEHRETNEITAAALRARGLTVFLSNADAAGRWMSKTYFSHRAHALLGAEAAPSGISLEEAEAATISAAVREIFASGASRAIVKMSGMAGGGNLLLDASDDVEDLVGAFLTKRLGSSMVWARIEAWMTWSSSYCCSFFLLGDGDPVHLALTQQILAPRNAGFVGSRGFLEIDDQDASAVVSHARVLADAMQADGLRGFTAVDLIVGAPTGRAGELVLPSGQALRFVECNPRINGHNQELKAVSLIAARDGRDLLDYVHLRVGNTMLPGTTAEARAALAELLTGIAAPLTDAPIGSADVRYVVDTNLGIGPPIHDGILFLTERDAGAPARLLRALEHLRARGLARA